MNTHKQSKQNGHHTRAERRWGQACQVCTQVGYKDWAFKILPPKNKSDTYNKTTGGQACINVGLPYIRGTSKNWPQFSNTMELGLTTSPSTSLSSPKTRHQITKSVASSMKSSVWNALRSMSVKLPAPWRQGWNLKQKSPRTAVGDLEHPIEMDNVKVIAWEDNMWWRKICESIEIRTRHQSQPGIWAFPIYDKLLSCDRRSGGHVRMAVTWPRRINLIHLMKWPWWSCKLATLQHIRLWLGIYLMN